MLHQTLNKVLASALSCFFFCKTILHKKIYRMLANNVVFFSFLLSCPRTRGLSQVLSHKKKYLTFLLLVEQ